MLTSKTKQKNFFEKSLTWKKGYIVGESIQLDNPAQIPPHCLQG